MKRYLPTFHQVEMNLSVGLRTGHMLAQHLLSGTTGVKEVDVTEGTVAKKVKFAQNGFIGQQTAAQTVQFLGEGADFSGVSGPLFVHFTEELHPTSNELMHYAEEEYGVPGEIYPRMIALYPGDQFTTTVNYTNATGRFWIEPATMPNGVTGYKYTFKG